MDNRLIVRIIPKMFFCVSFIEDTCNNFTDFFVTGLEANRERLAWYVEQSLMLVTALSPVIGYDRAAKAAHHAHEKGLTLKQACLELGYVVAEEFDRIVDARRMVRPVD